MGKSKAVSLEELKSYTKRIFPETYFAKSPKDLISVSNEVAKGRYLAENEDDFTEVAARVPYAVLTYEDTPEKVNKVIKYLCEGEKGLSCELCRALDKYTDKSYPPYYRLIQFLSRVFLERAALPGGRILSGAGLEGRKVTLTNCYVIPSPDDSIEGIMETAYRMVKTFSYGGGVGFDISTLRPEGSPVNNAARTSTGAWSFLHLYNQGVLSIGQQGRRGALLVSMKVSHPDIERFITSKSVLSPINQENMTLFKSALPEESWKWIETALTWTQLSGMNISVMINDDFMKAVKEGKEWPLTFEGKVYRTVKAQDLWDMIITSAWSSADPGILFESSAKRFSTTEYFSPVLTTNPCGEQWLGAGDNCNLAAVNFASPFYHQNKKAVITAMVIFMDAVIDYNLRRHPLEIQRKAAEENRRIGLGFMGLAEWFAIMKTPWSRLDSIKYLIDEEVGTLVKQAYKTSGILGEVLGPFEHFDREKHFSQPFFQRLAEYDKEFAEIIKNIKSLRNSALNTVAPTGTTSVIAGTSSGIEPFFFPQVRRYAPSLGKVLEYKFKPYQEWEKRHKNEPYPDYLKTAHEINPEHRVEVQGHTQMWIDNSISSTVNLPNSATKEDVKRIYEMAYERELKGITVYRDGSKFSIISNKDDEKKKKTTVAVEKKVEKKENVIEVPSFDREQLFDRPWSMRCVRYRIPTPERKINIVICGDRNNPLEIYLGSREANCYTHKIAVNMIMSSALTMLYKIDKRLYKAYLEQMLEKLKELKDDVFALWGERVNSVLGAIAFAMELFIKGKKPEEYMKSKFNLTLTILPDESGVEAEEVEKPKAKSEVELSNVKISLNATKDSDTKKGYVNLYGSDIDITDLPTDAYISKCPRCGTPHITKGTPYPFDCNNPCQVCDYAGKCSGD